nr:glycosyl transferase family 2 [Acidobacteriota bacterium]
FMTRAAFDAAGGFDEEYFASEEIHLARKLKRLGPFRMVRPPVVTSGRKFTLLGFTGMMRAWAGIASRGRAGLKRREGLDLWYGKHRGG